MFNDGDNLSTLPIFPKATNELILKKCPSILNKVHINEINTLNKLGISQIKPSIKDLKELEGFSGAIPTENGFAIIDYGRITKFIESGKVIETKLPKFEEIVQNEYNLTITKVDGKILTLKFRVTDVLRSDYFKNSYDYFEHSGKHVNILRDPDGKKAFIYDGIHTPYIIYKNGEKKIMPPAKIADVYVEHGMLKRDIERDNPKYKEFITEYNNLKNRISQYIENIKIYGTQ